MCCCNARHLFLSEGTSESPCESHAHTRELRKNDLGHMSSFTKPHHLDSRKSTRFPGRVSSLEDLWIAFPSPAAWISPQAASHQFGPNSWQSAYGQLPMHARALVEAHFVLLGGYVVPTSPCTLENTCEKMHCPMRVVSGSTYGPHVTRKHPGKHIESCLPMTQNDTRWVDVPR